MDNTEQNSMREIKYEKLPGKGVRSGFANLMFGSSNTLYLGPDHLLNVEYGRNYHEQYRRFYFKDIQAIQIVETNDLRISNIIRIVFMAFFLVFFLLLALLFDEGLVYFGAFVFIFIFLVSMLVKNSRGPTCRAYIRTAVQIDELPSLCHKKWADEVLPRIRHLIEDAQGGRLEPESTRQAIDQLQRTLTPQTIPAQALHQQPSAPSMPDSPNNQSNREGV
jgi:hypothetical protein